MNHNSTSQRRKRAANRKRNRTYRRAAQTLAASAAVAAGTQAYAEPIYFANPPGEGHFEWSISSGSDLLSVIHRPADQPAVDDAPATFRLASYGYGVVVQGVSSSEVQGIKVEGHPFASPTPPPLIGPIPTPGATFWPAAYVYRSYGSVLSLLGDGGSAYFGVRFDLGEGYHYGWVGVERTGAELDAFAWGYETEPGMPIGDIPEPDTVAMLAFGAALIGGRKRE